MSRTNRIVVSVATISTTNMTGLRIILRGLSFLNASPMAGMTILASVSVAAELREWDWMRSMGDMGVAFRGWLDLRSVKRAGLHRELLDHRAERHRGEVDEPPGDCDDADQQPDEEPAIGRERARGRRHDLLRRERAGDREHRDDHQEAADEHREAQRRVVERRAGGK